MFDELRLAALESGEEGRHFRPELRASWKPHLEQLGRSQVRLAARNQEHWEGTNVVVSGRRPNGV